jgi:hypothetical protein
MALFSRIQLHLYLLSEGNDLQHKQNEFSIKKDLFLPTVLVDEINRAPAKVQSALLEDGKANKLAILLSRDLLSLGYSEPYRTRGANRKRKSIVLC